MAKFSKSFLGCKSQEIHPTQFEAGDTCPKELEDAAREADSLLAKGKKLTAAEQKLLDEAEKNAAAALKELEDAAEAAGTALEADPENEDLKTAKAAADQAVADAKA